MPSGRNKTGTPKASEYEESKEYEKKVMSPALKLNLTSQGLVRKNNKVSPVPGLSSRPRAISNKESLEDIPMPKRDTKNKKLRKKKSERDFLHALKSMTKENEEPWMIFDPNNPYRACWDICIVLCLLYIFLFTPLDLAFAEPSSLGWKVFGALVDLIFWADIFVCFRTAYMSKDGELITDPKLIAKFYINDFFFIDLISCLPGFPLSYVIEEYVLEGGGSASIVKIGKAPRVLKVVRSLKIVRVLRVLKIAAFLEELRDSLPSLVVFIKMLKLLLITTFFLHINACIFVLVGQSSDRDGWLWINRPDDVEDWKTTYATALYYSTTTATTVGYGDITPQTTGERIFSTISMCIGVGLYGYIIGSMTDVVTSTSYVEHRLAERMDEVYAFLHKHPGFPKGLRKSLLKFYRNHFQQRRLIDEKELLQFLPSKLMKQVSHNVLLQGLNKISFFRHLRQDMFPRVMSLIEPMTFAPGEIIMDQDEMHHHPEFYILREGTVCVFQPTEVDENGIPKETREEMLLRVSVIVPRLLSKYDKNKDGTIDIHELGHLLKDMNGSNRFPPSTQIASVMDQLDVDGNGHVTTDEFVNWYVEQKLNKRKCAGECVAKLEPVCSFGTWRAFDLGSAKGSTCPYLYAAEAENAVEVSCISARDLFIEFNDDKETLELIFSELVRPAAKAGCDIDVVASMKRNIQRKGSTRMEPPGIRKKKSFRKSFYLQMQERVMSSTSVPRLSTVKARASSTASNMTRFDSNGSVMVTPRTPRSSSSAGAGGGSKNNNSNGDAAYARISHDFRRECGRVHSEVSAMRARVEDNAQKLKNLTELIYKLVEDKNVVV